MAKKKPVKKARVKLDTGVASMFGRVDIEKYSQGFKELKNFIPTKTTPTRRPGIKYVDLPAGAKIVAMTLFKETLFLATDKGVYEKTDKGFIPVPFVEKV